MQKSVDIAANRLHPLHHFVWNKYPLGTKSCRKCGLIIDVDPNSLDLTTVMRCEGK